MYVRVHNGPDEKLVVSGLPSHHVPQVCVSVSVQGCLAICFLCTYSYSHGQGGGVLRNPMAWGVLENPPFCAAGP